MEKMDLVEIDGLEFHVIINNEVDPMSPSPNAQVKHAASFLGVPLGIVADPESRGGARMELPMQNICCGAHGLSLLITATKGDQKHSVLFDAGPEGEFFEKNAKRLRLEMGNIEMITLSHWHKDHSGGIPVAIKLINEAKPSGEKVVVDVHPDRPEYRGAMLKEPISLEPDPTLAEIESAGGKLSLNSEARTVLGGMFLVSGEIPRGTEYEQGMNRGIRYVPEKAAWVTDELIADERFVMCKVKGKGLVVFTGCSHAGLINTARHAVQLDNSPVHAIVGGYHLADADEKKMQKSMEDLKALDPALLMPGHCTGWKFKGIIERELPGRMVPIFGGTKYELV